MKAFLIKWQSSVMVEKVCSRYWLQAFIHHPHHYVTAMLLSGVLIYFGDVHSMAIVWTYAIAENVSTASQGCHHA